MAAWARARREPLKSPIAALAAVKFCKAELPSCSLREQPLAMGETIPGGLRLALALLRGSISAK
jgi:hypothetical protein